MPDFLGIRMVEVHLWKIKLNILYAVIEGAMKYFEEDGCNAAMMLHDALFDQFRKVMDVLKNESPDE